MKTIGKLRLCLATDTIVFYAKASFGSLVATPIGPRGFTAALEWGGWALLPGT